MAKQGDIPHVEIPVDLTQLLTKVERLVVLTGAGISVESGIPTFRGPEGPWRTFKPEELATPQAFHRDPRLVWEWYDWRRGKIAQARPNPGHEALVRLEARIPDFTLLTQNVDGLHRLAGSQRLLEIHGSIWEVRCLACGQVREDRRVPIPNAYELFQGLQDVGVGVKLIVYKDFGHGISRPKEKLAAQWHNWQWFAKYIWDEEVEIPIEVEDEKKKK